MKSRILLIAVLIFPLLASAQNEGDKKFGIKFSGFVKNDFFYDSRQTVNAREGHFLLWPAAENLDIYENDVNAEPSFNFLSIQTRLKGTITGPDALGAKTSGVIEGAFFGHTNADINGFRLRHAFIKLDWEKASLLTGQYWHPMFVTSCFPGTISFNTGAGIQPFSRNPQMRFTYKAGAINISAIAYSERDFASRGLNNAPSSRFIRNSGIPATHLHMEYKSKNEEGMKVIAGLGGGYHVIRPQQTTSTGVVTRETVNSMSGVAYAKFVTKPLTIKLEGAYVENSPSLLLFGGYAVMDTLDVTDAEVSYTPVANLTFWTDIHTNGKKWQFGIFAGYNKNMGTREEINGGIFGLSTSVASVYRISPRVQFNAKKFRVAAELEYTAAAWGDGTFDEFGIPQNTKEVSNIRGLLGFYYFF